MPARSRANREFNQFEGEGRKYAPKVPRKTREPQQFADAAKEPPEDPLVEVSNPYIGGNTVRKRGTL